MEGRKFISHTHWETDFGIYSIVGYQAPQSPPSSREKKRFLTLYNDFCNIAGKAYRILRENLIYSEVHYFNEPKNWLKNRYLEKLNNKYWE